MKKVSQGPGIYVQEVAMVVVIVLAFSHAKY
jgi:hypothetical protein